MPHPQVLDRTRSGAERRRPWRGVSGKCRGDRIGWFVTLAADPVAATTPLPNPTSIPEEGAMDPQRFDTLTRRIAAPSRRQVLSALITSALGAALGDSDTDEVAAACHGYNAKCKKSSSCCADEGLRCVKVGKGGKGKHGKKRRKRRCRCKNGTCPAQTPCCIGGTCEELCDGECCADCFVELDIGGNPDPTKLVCCVAGVGTICGPTKQKHSDDRCCYPEEECIDGRCCCDGCRGSVVCGGKCCAIEACCNDTCCPQGKVCATTPDGDTCVSAQRACDVPGDCFTGEACHGGVCCAGDRICGDGLLTPEVCCAADEYCEMPNNECCPISESCGAGSFKGHRVRR